MQGHFWKNFPGARAPESRGADAGAPPEASGPLDARLGPRGAPRGRAALPPAHQAPLRPPPGPPP